MVEAVEPSPEEFAEELAELADLFGKMIEDKDDWRIGAEALLYVALTHFFHELTDFRQAAFVSTGMLK